MRWFGEDWEAPVCREGEHVPTPVGEPCDWCKKPIEADDQGVVLVRYPDEKDCPVHIECLLGAAMPARATAE